jgi:hypothetical protein
VRLSEHIRRKPLGSILALLALVTGLFVLGAPFAAARYAPLTDLPFHAAQASIFRHYADPSFHLREQFELHPLAVPYMSMYALGALLMLVLPPVPAIDVAGFVMLALLPAGLAVMFHGMKKSPLLGLLGLPLAWNHLSHWGFLPFVGALGLFAMTIGLTLMVLDRPTRGRRLALTLVLVALFFTHVFRYPFAVAGVLGTAIVMYPATRRFRPVLLPLLPSLLLFAIWWKVRPEAVQNLSLAAPDLARLHELRGYVLQGGSVDPAEAKAIDRAAATVGLAVLGCALAVPFEGRLAAMTRRARAWAVGVTLVPLCCAAAFLLLFLMLPMQAGVWWYVYPREAVAAAFLLLGASPDLPRAAWLRAPLCVALCLGALGVGRFVTAEFRAFDEATADFAQITRKIPQAPKLLYLVFDHGGTHRRSTPFIHLPAYVQAEKGGWLSFHFAVFGASPVSYRRAGAEGAVVPPPVPVRWEWAPQKFRVLSQGPFFDWFLVRSPRQPDDLFRPDPSIIRVDHVGTWWLYQRRPAPTTAPQASQAR